MRAFIGIPIETGLMSALARASVAGRASGVPALRDARWVPPVNLHLTIRFLGEVDPSSADTLFRAVAGECDGIDPFDIPLQSAVTPIRSASRATMLWSMFGDPHDECSALVDQISSALAHLGIPPEARPFRPHVTLARFKRPASIPQDAIDRMNEQVEACLAPAAPTMSVRTVTLYSSTLTRHGAVYEKVWDLPLGLR